MCARRLESQWPTEGRGVDEALWLRLPFARRVRNEESRRFFDADEILA